eukprot:3018614-Pyramimonas_sp.AAC.1
MWCSAVGSWVQGSDACHRKAKPQGAVGGRAARKEDASNTCDLRVAPRKWQSRQGERPGSILEEAMKANGALKVRGLPADRIAGIEPQ